MNSVRDHKVFGVPTFIVGDAATFVRLRSRPQGDAARCDQDASRASSA